MLRVIIDVLAFWVASIQIVIIVSVLLSAIIVLVWITVDVADLNYFLIVVSREVRVLIGILLILDGTETAIEQETAKLLLLHFFFFLVAIILFLIVLVRYDVFDLGYHLLVSGGIGDELFIFDYGLAEVGAKFLEHRCVEVEVGILSEITATETGLNRKRILNLKFLPPDDSTRSFFRSLHNKRAV